MSADPEISVTITDYEFTLNELEDFISRARQIDEIAWDALVKITHQFHNGPTTYTFEANSEFREKE